MDPLQPDRSDETLGTPRDARAAGGSWGALHLQLLEQLAPPSLLVDARHTIVHLSPTAGRFLQPAGGEPSHDLLRSVHPGLREPLRAALQQARDGQPVQVDGVPIQLGGEPTALSLRVVPAAAGDAACLVVFQPQGGDAAPAGVQAGQGSQAELLDALADAQRARQQLAAADAAKDRFLAVLSHELRNPLASIASASELLLVPRLPEAAREKAAQVVQRQARAMKALLDELLDVSRLALGRLTLARRPVGMAAIVQSALESTRALVQAAGHELVVQLPALPMQVDGDPLRLAQVVSNLVSNAAKYTPEGGRVVVSAEVLHDEVVVTVADNGVGMAPAEIDGLFDLTPGEGAPDRANGGLGIGLALARNIVELHGGWILASSAGPGLGSQLRVGLPLLRGAEPAPIPEPVPQPPRAAAAAQGELILVADDNGDAAWGMAKLLELSGFRAVLARSGAEALRVAEQQRPAIALLDIGMPDLSGHEVARRLRQVPWGRAMVLIAATGWNQASDVRQSMEAGFDAHLTKPLNVGRIRAVIEEIAAGRGRAG